MADEKKKDEKPRDIKAELKEIGPLIEDTKKAIKVVSALEGKVGKYARVSGAIGILQKARQTLLVAKADREDELASK